MINSDIIRGHLDSIILSLIIEKDRYGYEISKEISQRTGGEFEIKEATLYAVFQRLMKKRFISSYYGDETLGGRRKYYKATALGNKYFNESIKEWNDTKRIIDIFME
jgi:PadR family transcriptional regulator, regulatory protein PadR